VGRLFVSGVPLFFLSGDCCAPCGQHFFENCSGVSDVVAMQSPYMGSPQIRPVFLCPAPAIRAGIAGGTLVVEVVSHFVFPFGGCPKRKKARTAEIFHLKPSGPAKRRLLPRFGIRHINKLW